MITKDTIIGGSVATFLTIGAGIWAASGTVQGHIAQIVLNTQAIASVVTSLELSRIDRQIEVFKKERRDLKRQLRDDPNNGLLQDQILELDDSIRYSEIVRECIVDPAKAICK